MRPPRPAPNLLRPMPTRIAFAASSDFLDLDDSWPLIRGAVEEAGMTPEVVAWDAPPGQVDWGRFDLVAAHYVWGYVLARGRFLEWAGHVADRTRLVNPLPLLRWSSEKTYLADLHRAGVPVVPTVWVPPGGQWSPPAGEFVVKPTVASGGMGAARYGPEDPSATVRAHVAALHDSGHTVMVQPYKSSVDTSGETALVYFGGRFSHALRKGALLRPGAGIVERLWEQQVITATEPTVAERRVGDMVMRFVAERLGPAVYGRVDMVADGSGGPVVLEVELVEPSLFLTPSTGGAGRLAAVLHREIDRV